MNIFISRSVLFASIIGAALATGGFFIAPNHDEQRAMEQRNIYERAQLLYTTGDHETGIDVLKHAVAAGDVNAEMIRTLLRYYASAGRAEEHFDLLRSDASDLLNPTDLRAAMSLYRSNGMENAAVAICRMLVRRGAATAFERATLASSEEASGHVQMAVAMATQIGGSLAVGADADSGAAVVRVLTLANRRDLAASFLTRWINESTPLPTAMAVAPALIENGYPEYAVEALRAHQRSSQEARDVYVHALREASARSPALRAELTRNILTELQNLPGGEIKEVALHDLFAFGDMDMAISNLASTGAWRDQSIRPAFVYSLRSQGRTAALTNLLSSEARASETNYTEARSAARELVEIGSIPQAEAALMAIAEREGPQGGALTDLFYVLAQHHHAPNTAWFAARARAAQGGEVERWIAAVALSASGSAAVATIDAVGVHPDPNARAVLAVLKARYLAWQGDSPALHRALAATEPLQLSANQAGEMARLACMVGDADAAFQLSPRAAGSTFADELDRCASRFSLLSARRALAAGDVSQALDRYSQVAATGQTMTAQDYFDYAEATRTSDRAAFAPPLFEAALARLPDQQTVDNGLLRAAILGRLQRFDEARAALESVVAAHPHNNRARVTLIQFLLDRGAFQDALRLTNENPSNDGDDTPAADSHS